MLYFWYCCIFTPHALTMPVPSCFQHFFCLTQGFSGWIYQCPRRGCKETGCNGQWSLHQYAPVILPGQWGHCLMMIHVPVYIGKHVVKWMLGILSVLYTVNAIHGISSFAVGGCDAVWREPRAHWSGCWTKGQVCGGIWPTWWLLQHWLFGFHWIHLWHMEEGTVVHIQLCIHRFVMFEVIPSCYAELFGKLSHVHCIVCQAY